MSTGLGFTKLQSLNFRKFHAKNGKFRFFTNIGMLGVYIGVFEHAELIPDVYFDARPSHCPQNLISALNGRT